MNIPEEGERTCFRIWEESEEELWNMLCCICCQMTHHLSETPLQQLSDLAFNFNRMFYFPLDSFEIVLTCLSSELSYSSITISIGMMNMFIMGEQIANWFHT